MIRAALAIVVLAAVAGCSSGGSSTSSATLTAPPPPIGRDELGALVLTPSEIQAVVPNVHANRGPRILASDDVVDATLDPRDTSVDVDLLRWESGVVQDLTRAGPRTRKGIIHVSATAEVFHTDEWADEYISVRATDFQANQHSGYAAGGIPSVEYFTDFGVDGLGREAQGVVLRIDLPADDAYVTMIFVRRGRVVGKVEIIRVGLEDSRDEVEALALTLAHRIENVLNQLQTSVEYAWPGDLGPSSAST